MCQDGGSSPNRISLYNPSSAHPPCLASICCYTLPWRWCGDSYVHFLLNYLIHDGMGEKNKIFHYAPKYLNKYLTRLVLFCGAWDGTWNVVHVRKELSTTAVSPVYVTDSEGWVKIPSLALSLSKEIMYEDYSQWPLFDNNYSSWCQLVVSMGSLSLQI